MNSTLMQSTGTDCVAAPLVVCWLLLVAALDQRTLRLPNRWLLPAVAAVAAASTVHPVALVAAGTAALPYLGAFAIGHCGAGDVKLAFVVGGLLGAPLVAALAVVGAQLIVLARAGVRRTPLPSAHGPPLCAATLALLAMG